MIDRSSDMRHILSQIRNLSEGVEVLDEVTAVTGLEGKAYYHGTSSTERARSILKNGIQAQADAAMGRTARGAMTPVKGMVYATPHLRYAIIYALGGNFVGQNPPPAGTSMMKDQYGYLFVIPGENLSQLQPDEDEIGAACRESLAILTRIDRGDPPEKIHAQMGDNVPFGEALRNDTGVMRSMLSLARAHLTPGQKDKLFNGYEYGIMAQAGKKLVKVMPDSLKTKLINMGCHVAHQGSIIPTECWRIDKSKSAAIGFQGENFFKVAKRVKRL